MNNHLINCPQLIEAVIPQIKEKLIQKQIYWSEEEIEAVISKWCKKRKTLLEEKSQKMELLIKRACQYIEVVELDYGPANPIKTLLEEIHQLDEKEAKALFYRERNRLQKKLTKLSFRLNKDHLVYLKEKCENYVQIRQNDPNKTWKEELKKAKNSTAWSKVDKSYKHLIIGYLIKRGATKTEAQEIYYEALFILWEYLNKLDFILDGTIIGFLIITSYNAFRKRKRGGIIEILTDFSLPIKDQVLDIDAGLNFELDLDLANESFLDIYWIDWESAQHLFEPHEKEIFELKTDLMVECLKELETVGEERKQKKLALMDSLLDTIDILSKNEKIISSTCKMELEEVNKICQHKKYTFSEEEKKPLQEKIATILNGWIQVEDQEQKELLGFIKKLKRTAKYVTRYEVIEARFFEGLSHKEIADLGQTNPNNSQAIQYEAILQLKNCVENKQ